MSWTLGRSLQGNWQEEGPLNYNYLGQGPDEQAPGPPALDGEAIQQRHNHACMQFKLYFHAHYTSQASFYGGLYEAMGAYKGPYGSYISLKCATEKHATTFVRRASVSSQLRQGCMHTHAVKARALWGRLASWGIYRSIGGPHRSFSWFWSSASSFSNTADCMAGASSTKSKSEQVHSRLPK